MSQSPETAMRALCARSGRREAAAACAAEVAELRAECDALREALLDLVQEAEWIDAHVLSKTPDGPRLTNKALSARAALSRVPALPTQARNAGWRSGGLTRQNTEMPRGTPTSARISSCAASTAASGPP